MENNVYQMDRSRRGGNKSGNGGDGMNGDLEKRVEKLEASMSEIKQDLAILKTRSENFSTKSDLMALTNTFKTEQMALQVELHKALSGQTKWMIGAIFTAVALSLTAAKYLF
ncbi:hypothetical protein [Citrobacter amalonaticus]|uniref:hypothetical protein n=1 Tax=Citrobacter amalonaticus TaxID=35703 RepID=UPI003749672E|nr:hypothetical protein [Salmonella enterica subsp. enterica serovar Poona]